MEGDLESHGLYRKDASGRVLSVQRGTMRTNCVDNLDRTNVVQVRAALALSVCDP